jgi:endonuclease/exonuclease/phosphatase (EEP) superfamily protein YafD
MQITFLFWNIRRNPIEALVAHLAQRYEVDVVILAESTINPANLLKKLNDCTIEYHFSRQVGCLKIQLFSRFESSFIEPIFEHGRMTVRRLNLPGLTEILISMVHMPSKHDWSSESQADECNRIAEEIRGLETQVGHSRTILVGDLNQNPFDHGVVSARGFHAVMSREIAQ